MSALDRGVVVVSSAQELAGAEVYLLALLTGLEQRLPIEVLLSDQAPAELFRRIEGAHATATTVPGLRRRPSTLATARLVQMLAARRPALVHVNLSDQGDGLTAIAAARIAGASACATLHLVVPGRRAALERLSRAALRGVSEVIAVSAAVGAYSEGQGARTSVVANGVVASAARPEARAELDAKAGDFVIGGIGRLDAQKGWDILCAAAAKVRARVPNSRFVVIGDGPERTPLASQAGASHVRFVGYREHAAELVSGMDVLAIPSRYEGFGLVAVEAMSAGVPVVAARVGGLPEVLGDAGMLVPPEDPAALAAALISLAEQPALRAELGRRGAERARARFGHERMATQTLAVWERVAQHRAQAAPAVASSQ